MEKILFRSKYQYREAKKFLEDAQKLSKGFSSPTYSRNHYVKNGIEYVEFDSHLESPYDDYSLYEVVKE